MNWNVLKSIFKRDFVSYFSSPTGYVFICVFVLLSSAATFWPPEFFASNLANLDQLSRWLPFIMLVFIPAITMSIWAEERRQGTDELLLTTPASDFDVVLGKYLAGVAIFTVSLLFSAFSIFLVFKWGLGDPDFGLFFSTFVGYWFIGLAMIAIGMVASFLTDNLTVGFILGTLFNLPLALFGVADWFIKNPAVAQTVRQWSALEQFRDFERGVISLGGATYFVALSAVMIYLSMVLIGRRHWQARDEGNPFVAHFAVRTLALLCVAIGLTELAQNRNWLRADVSSEQLSSLSPDTLEIIRKLRDDPDAKTVHIDAYVSPQVPTEYTDTKLNLLSTLAELQALSGGKVQVTKHEIENFGPEALVAEQKYGITPEIVMVEEAGEQSREELLLAAAVTAGLDRVVIPFIDKGIPVEYELVRSISTVTSGKRLKVGILDTGIPNVQPLSDRQRESPLITELRKQYDIDDEPLSASQPIPDNYDVLLAVQPSMLGPQEMDHFVDAVRRGVPTLILEDPMPVGFRPPVPGTAEPRQQPGMMGMFGGGPIPKGDIEQLWRSLGIQFDPIQVVWQNYQPDSSVRAYATPEWVFVDANNGAQEPLNADSPITSGLNQLLFLYPGSFSRNEDSKLEFEQLAVTGPGVSGEISTRAVQSQQPELSRMPTTHAHILAAAVHGKITEDDLLLMSGGMAGTLDSLTKKDDDSADVDDDPAGADSADEPKSPDQQVTELATTNINTVIVADVDCILPDFFYLRQSGNREVLEATQNVTFILNIIDTLADDNRFIDIRKRVRKHRSLAKIDEATEQYRTAAQKEEEQTLEEVENKISEAKKRFQEQVAAVDKIEGLSEMAKRQRLETVQVREQARLDADMKQIEAERNRRRKQIQYELEQEVRGVQDRYKLYAILVPPIPPLLVALFVFFRRREAEREGIAKSRLR